MNLRKLVYFLTITVGLSLAASAEVEPECLRCEYAEDPLGVDVAAPRLSWQLDSDDRAQVQTSYRVLVASSPKLLVGDQGDLWDSGRVVSADTLCIPYRGRTLQSSQKVFWKVCAWDARGLPAWSKPATWTMGVLSAGEWGASWIGAADTNLQSMLLRREFKLRGDINRAVVHVCGLAQYELSVNGRKSGEDLITPGWSKYDKTCLYETHDITRLVQGGANVVGITLGNGMYRVPGGRYVKFKGSFGPLQAIAQIRLEYADGSVDTIGTDPTWQVQPGPYTFTCVFGGEDFDARRLPAGWDIAGYNADVWNPAVATSGPGGVLRGHSCAAPPLRVIQDVAPVRIKPLRENVEIYDLGQNAPIMPLIRVKGPPGSIVRITPAELLKEDGSLDRRSAGGGAAYWQYTLAGGKRELWFPKFFYHGCRYLQVERLPGAGTNEPPVVEALVGKVVHTASEPIGDFACSNRLFNRIRTLIRWAQRANLVSVVSDCPHRERLGWLEQYHLNGPSLRYEFDLAQLFAKGMNDMKDSQIATGMVPSIAPEYTIFGKSPEDESNAFRNSPEWGSAIVLVPWQQYEFTGDTELLERYYEPMKRYVAYLESRAKDHVIDFGLGDWYDIGPKPPGVSQLTPRALTATAFYYYDSWVLAQTARLLNRPDDAGRFDQLARKIRQAFNAKFYDSTKSSYATGSQCANAIPLVMNICDPENRATVLKALVGDVESRGNAVTAGDVGYRYLLRALADGGRSDVIFAMNNQSEKPGYGYQLKQGATSLTEAWDALRSSSQNHFMLGQIMEWFYGDLAGIAPDPAGPGFKRILIRPQPVAGLDWAMAKYHSVRGQIVSSWRREARQFYLDVEIPANTTATVFVPAKSGASVKESGKPATGQRGLKFLRMEGDKAVFEVASGKYRFGSGE